MSTNNNHMDWTGFVETSDGVYEHSDGRVYNFNIPQTFTSVESDGTRVTSVHNPLFDGPFPERPTWLMLQEANYRIGIDPYRREADGLGAMTIWRDGRLVRQETPSQETSRHPVIPPGFIPQLSEEQLNTLRAYQVMYEQCMAQLEARLTASRRYGVTALTEQANEIRRQAEQAVGIRRETHGRIQEYPLTPNEAFATSVNVPQISREEIERTFSELFYGQSRPRTDRQIRIFMTEEGMQQYQEALLQASNEIHSQMTNDMENLLWWGEIRNRETRRDKPKKSTIPKPNDSPYWGYQSYD